MFGLILSGSVVREHLDDINSIKVRVVGFLCFALLQVDFSMHSGVVGQTSIIDIVVYFICPSVNGTAVASARRDGLQV